MSKGNCHTKCPSGPTVVEENAIQIQSNVRKLAIAKRNSTVVQASAVFASLVLSRGPSVVTSIKPSFECTKEPGEICKYWMLDFHLRLHVGIGLRHTLT